MTCLTQEQMENPLGYMLDPTKGAIRGYLRRTALLRACAVRTELVVQRLEPDVEHCLVTGKPGCCDECQQPVCLFTV